MATSIRIINKLHSLRLEEFARQRLDLILGRFEDRVASIDVSLRDENADKGGLDKKCSIDAHLIPRGMVHVQATEREMEAAILKAIHRLETVVLKAIDRGRRSMAVRHAGGGLSREKHEPIGEE